MAKKQGSQTEAGPKMKAFIDSAYPICRSITGQGLRDTLALIQQDVPLEIHGLTTNTTVLDWTIPKEWNIRDAWIKNAEGEKVVDFNDHNLHVLGYSTPVHETLSLDALKQHCYTLPEHPDWIPFRNSFYAERWGFCLSQNQLDALPDGDYEVFIDSDLEDGELNYGECVLPGRSTDTVLISTHCCHPSLANDNLSGMAVAIELIKLLQKTDHHYTYRFIFTPGTIGAIAWLARNRDLVNDIAGGLILACVGDDAPPSYKLSRQGDSEIDRILGYLLRQCNQEARIHPFSPYGYDERQYCSPGFNLPVGCFMRSGPAGYPEYHSSADNPDLVSESALVDSLELLHTAIQILEGNATYTNLSPYGEPQLGRRGLYSTIGGSTDSKAMEMALLWILNYSDGEHSLLEIAERSGVDFALIREAADALLDAGLLQGEGEATKAQTAPPVAPTAETTSDTTEIESSDFWDDFLEGDTDIEHDDEIFQDFG